MHRFRRQGLSEGLVDARVTIVHDFMEAYGGAERITEEMAAAIPQARIFTIAGRPEVFERMGIADRVTTLVPSREYFLRNYRLGAPAYPLIARRRLLPESDLLLSASYGFAHHFQTVNRAPHVTFCYSPLRFAWTMTSEYRSFWAPGRSRAAAFELFARAMRQLDRVAASRPDAYLAYSKYIAGQVRRYYGREATVVGAPLDCDRFRPDPETEVGDYYLFCGRLIEPYKRLEPVLDAFRDLPFRLVVAGDGPDGDRLRTKAPSNVEFVGQLDDAELVPLLSGCRALVFPSQDDLGLLPLEAMACGRPVVAYGAGGALETVIPGVTGEFFDEQTPSAIQLAIRRFDPETYDPHEIRGHALAWDRDRFRERLLSVLESVVSGAESVPARVPADADVVTPLA